MQFSFELLSVKCERVLSTEDSPWGEADGIRVVFIVLTTGGFHEVLISSSDTPSFVPGKTLPLDQFPPQNAGTWELTPPSGLSDADSVMITILGVNEGLSWVGGGGGSGGGGVNLKVFEELAQKGAEKAAANKAKKMLGEGAEAGGEAAGGAVFAAAWSLIEGLIEELNRSTECRGVAFCYPIELSMRKLLLDLLVRKNTTLQFDGSSPSTGLGLIAAAQIPGGCGSPSYKVDLYITRVDSLYIAVDDVAGEPRMGERSAMPVLEEACRQRLSAGSSGPLDWKALDLEMYTWPVYVDRTITLTPSHYYPLLKPAWYVNGVELGRDEDTLNLSLPVSTLPLGEETVRSVAVRYERVTRKGKENLVLHTRGEEGNFKLEVSLRLNFEGVDPPPPEPWPALASAVVLVTGSEIDGNDAWYRYLRCVMHRQLEKEMEKRLPPERLPGKKPEPLEIATLRLELRRLVLPQILAEHHLEAVKRVR